MKEGSPALLDPGPLRQLVEHNGGESVGRLVTLFLEDGPSRLTAIREAFARGDRDTLRQEAHALRGSSAIVGAAALAALCTALDEHYGAVSAAADVVEGLGEVYERTAELLGERLAGVAL